MTKAGSTKTTNIDIWGSIDESQFAALSQDFANSDKNLKINYRKIDESKFSDTFVEALASGKGPDIFILPQDLILRNRDKIFPIPYASMSERAFRDSFTQGAELYLSPEGILAMPFSVDPLLMYWNRDIFNSAGIANPPRFWDEFSSLATKLTEKNAAGVISQSTVALGESSNIKNSKEIISAMIMQAGNPIVSWKDEVPFNSLSYGGNGAREAVNFFVEFANPAKALYTWSRALPNSQNFFAGGNLAVYFGFASELPEISAKNPNLNFDVGYFPQLRDSKVRLTAGKFKALAISKQSKNIQTAFSAVVALSGSEAVSAYNAATGLPPVRRDLQAVKPSDAYGTVLFDSALWAGSWLDPNPKETDGIYGNMIGSITAGADRVDEAFGRAAERIEALLAM